MGAMRFWQQGSLADHTGRPKDGEGIDEHVKPDAGEPKAIASTELPEAKRLPFGGAAGSGNAPSR